jgi:hypothetical protein
MDGWGIGIFVVGLILYFVSKKRAIFLFISGVGAGIFIGAVWAYFTVTSLF